jgi:hypothetical protein
MGLILKASISLTSKVNEDRISLRISRRCSFLTALALR